MTPELDAAAEAILAAAEREPWAVQAPRARAIVGGDRRLIAEVVFAGDGYRALRLVPAQDTAAAIVRAVNAHAGLRRALHDANDRAHAILLRLEKAKLVMRELLVRHDAAARLTAQSEHTRCHCDDCREARGCLAWLEAR